jgi:hypothetical protein
MLNLSAQHCGKAAKIRECGGAGYICFFKEEGHGYLPVDATRSRRGALLETAAEELYQNVFCKASMQKFANREC